MSDYLGMTGNHTGRTFDKELELVPSDTALAASTGTTPVAVGDGLIDADLVIDLATPAAAAANLTLQFSADEAFTTAVAGPTIAVAKDALGRLVFPFRNDPEGTPLGYVRILPSAAAKLGAFIAKR